MTARRTPPAWLDLSTPTTDRPRAQQCTRCGSPILRALVGNPCGLDVRADPYPLDLRAELAARLDGRTSYCLRVHPYLPPRLINRSAFHIAGGKCTHLVVADHACPARGSPNDHFRHASNPTTPPSESTLFDL